MKTKSPSSARGTVTNPEGDDFPNEPGWYRWVPNYGVGEGCPEYVMVNYCSGYDGLRVWRVNAKRNLPVCIMIGEWSFFAKLNNDPK